MPSYFLLESGGRLLAEDGGRLALEDSAADAAAGVWRAAGPGRNWSGRATGRDWRADVADVLTTPELTEQSPFTRLRFYLDCGDVREVRGGDLIDSVSALSSGAGLTVVSSRAETGGYRASAVLSSATPGDYTVTFTCTLQSGATFSRVGTIHVL